MDREKSTLGERMQMESLSAEKISDEKNEQDDTDRLSEKLSNKKKGV